MACQVLSTPLADKQAAGLRGPNRKSFDAFIAELGRRGCAAMHYRLSGNPPVGRLCSVHLRGSWRAIVAFEEPDRAWIVLVGEHLEEPHRSVYELLYRLVDHVPEPGEGRRKPPCCGDEGEPQLVDLDVVDALSARVRDVVPRRAGR